MSLRRPRDLAAGWEYITLRTRLAGIGKVEAPIYARSESGLEMRDRKVAAVFAEIPQTPRAMLLTIRDLIFATADAEGVGPVTETLKWGEPAYLTAQSKAGSTIRLGWKPASPSRVAIYFNCRTTLVETFRTMFGGALTFEGDRAVLLEIGRPLPIDMIQICLAAALTYHQASGRRAR